MREYVIRVNRWGLVQIFTVEDNKPRFSSYVSDNKVETAVRVCTKYPLTILTTNEGL